MTIQELEHYLSHSSNYPLLSLQSIYGDPEDHLEVCEHVLPDGKIVELTLDRQKAKMILEVYRDGDLVGEPINFFYKSVTDSMLGEDWIQLEPIEVIHRILERESSLGSA